MSVGFFIPGSLGVQEGAYMVLGHIFGVDAPIALGFSLLRRGRELVVGIPVLLIWQLLEMQNFHHQHSNAKIEQVAITPMHDFAHKGSQKEDGCLD